MGPSRGPLGPSRAPLGPSCGSLGPSWGRPGAVLGASPAVMGRSWELLGPSCGVGKPKRRESKKHRKTQWKINDFVGSDQKKTSYCRSAEMRCVQNLSQKHIRNPRAFRSSHELSEALKSSQELSRAPRSLWASKPVRIQLALGLGGEREAFTISKAGPVVAEAKTCFISPG